ncbi:hypothetical protein EDB86DRAFT_2814219, partial [Lactarius hatsudake]
DYLTIQGLSVASECAFSSSQLTGTYLCNCLKTDTFEALQIVRSAFAMAFSMSMMKQQPMWQQSGTLVVSLT